MQYKLIACDMDATALTTDKRLTRRTAAAMEKALSAGKQVVFATGRNLCIVRPYLEQVRGMRYAVTSAGAAVNDVFQGIRLAETNLDAETVKWIIAAAAGVDTLPVLYSGDAACCPDWAPRRAGEFHVAEFASMYANYMGHAEDVFADYMEHPGPLQKMNLLFCEKAARDEVYEKIKFLPLRFSSLTGLTMEINAPGVSKAAGLRTLCAHLGVEPADCVAVGDADNDLEMLRAVGLGVAMGNALPAVKAAAAAVVSDCDHDGCAEAIEEFLL